MEKERLKLTSGDLNVAYVMWTCRWCTFSRRVAYSHMVNAADSDNLDHAPSSTSVLSCVLISAYG